MVTLRTITAIAIVFPALLIYRRQLLRPPRGSLSLFTALGLSVALNYSSFFQAVARLPVGVAISFFYLYPVLVAIGARFLLKERFPLEKTTALLIAVFGCSLISGVWESSVSISAMGIFFALSSASGCATYTLLVKVAVRKHSPERVLAYSLAFALPFLLLANLLTREPVLIAYPLPAWGIILLLALVPTLLGYYLFALALRWIESSRASITATVEPVLASLLAYAALGEKLSTLQILGLSLIITGAVLVQQERG